MPNHFHGIVVLGDHVGAGSPRPDSPRPITKTEGGEIPYRQTPGGETPPLRKFTLGQIVGYFKYQSTKQVNLMRDNPGVPLWQRNYYERVIRSEAELMQVRQYILNNPLQWEMDKENPANIR